jgi:hypothetical protein
MDTIEDGESVRKFLAGSEWLQVVPFENYLLDL